jgi:hypothetical protein
MSHTALLQTMIDHIDEADAQSTEEVLHIVCEVFIAAFQQHTSSGNEATPSRKLGSHEEAQLEALQLALALYRKAEDAACLRTVLTAEAHHPTSALFLQGSIGIAFPDKSSARGTKELQQTALSVVEAVGMTVGRASCQRLLPGIASASSKYLFAYLPRRGAHCQRRSSLCRAAETLTAWIQVCFELPVSNHSAAQQQRDQPPWSEGDQQWAAVASPKLIPLIMRVLDAHTIGDVAVGVPSAVVQSLLPLCGALFQATWYRGVCPPPTARSLVCSAVLLRSVGRNNGAAELAEEPMEWLEFSTIPADVAARGRTMDHDLASVASWDALLEFTCAPTHQFGPAYIASLSLMASLAASCKGRERREMLAHSDGIFLWRLVRRAVRYCTDPHTSLAADDVGLLQMTTKERRLRASSLQHDHMTKSLMDLLDDLLSSVGALASSGGGDVLECLMDQAESVLQDWDAYAAHTEVIYIISRIVVFGALPRPADAACATRLLQAFVQQQTFETLWELVSLDHLWKIEISADQCTFQELQHRGLVARTVLAAVRQTAESLAAVVSYQSGGSTQQQRGPNVVLERFMVLCLYNAFEKESCSFGDVHEAASITVKTLSELNDAGRSSSNATEEERGPASTAASLSFFFQYCKTLTDEARRAVLDPELHAGSIKVVSGLLRFVTRSLGLSVREPSLVPAVPAVHMRAMTAFAQDTIEMLVSSITEWRHRKGLHSAPIVGCLNVLQHAVGLVVTLTAASPRAYPSEDDWDDERRWTSTDPRVMVLQELVWNTVFQKLHPMCMAPNTAIASRTVSITMLMLEMFRTPVEEVNTINVGKDSRVPEHSMDATSDASAANTAAVHRCGIVRTHLNTLHRAYHAFEDLLVAGWRQRKEDALLVLTEARTMATLPSTNDLTTMAPGSKRTKRSTLLRSGRWLADIPIPVELPDVIAALSALAAMAPAFLSPRVAEEAVPAVLLWYVRCQWMVHVPTRREETTWQACVAFLKAAVDAARAAGFGDAVQSVLERCRGAVLAAHWPELYEEVSAVPLSDKEGTAFDSASSLAELQAVADSIRAALSAAEQATSEA